IREYPRMKYILTLQESVALMIGDGYARATAKPALVQIHSSPGLGNAIGALYQAMRGHAPLVVIGADAGLKYMPMDAQMAADLVALARPVTKWSTMVLDPSSLLRTIRRAIKIAGTPPMGPVYVCLPADVLDSPCVETVFPTSFPTTRVAPDATFIKEAAALLAGAERPMIFIGDGVAFSGAQEEVARVAERVGAEIWGVDAGELNVSYAHPLYQGQTGHMFGQASLPITSRGDVNLICGTYMVPEVFPHLGDIFAPDARVIHIDLNAYEIAKNHRVDMGVVSDPRLTLSMLSEALEPLLKGDRGIAARARAARIASETGEKRKKQLAADQKTRDEIPLHASRFMEELARELPADAVIFDEALTSSPDLTRYIPPTTPGHFFQTRGGSLGVGIPGALGAKLANPDKTVVGFTGDGGSMYTIQALWTAAHHGIGAKFVVCNNQSYMLLELNILQYWKERGIEAHDFPESFLLREPGIDFAALSRSLGVPAARVQSPNEIGPAIREMLETEGPFLIDCVMTSRVPGAKG
ncbi:MAG TPA: thiamine pyrophosphate-binding protein, partial [Spirochaetia bacterium]|nr:thiamine pyrophosphate-binding protein [Spirochaetia bacterium]